MNTKDDVKKFMIAADQNVVTMSLREFEDAQVKLYAQLIGEEFSEFLEGFLKGDMVECADACADLIWVIEGFCYSAGIQLQRVWDEVARSNHSKISDSGKIVKRSDGKVLKPDTYSPPDIKGAMDV